MPWGPHGHIRVDANGVVWDTDTAITVIPQLDKAAGGLQYAEQPCRTIDELVAVRRKVTVRIAADESIRRAEDPLRIAVAGAADIAVIKCTPAAWAPCPLLGGDVVPEANSLRPADSYLQVLRTPPVPDPALLDACELTDERRAAWWRDRLRRVRLTVSAAG